MGWTGLFGVAGGLDTIPMMLQAMVVKGMVRICRLLPVEHQVDRRARMGSIRDALQAGM